MLSKFLVNLLLIIIFNLCFCFSSLAIELPLNCTDSNCTFGYFVNNRCREIVLDLDTNQFSRNNLSNAPDFESCNFSINDVFFDSQSSETELTLSSDLSRLIAHIFYAVTFHGVGISLVFLSSGYIWFRRR